MVQLPSDLTDCIFCPNVAHIEALSAFVGHLELIDLDDYTMSPGRNQNYDLARLSMMAGYTNSYNRCHH